MLGSTVVDTIWISRESLPTTLSILNKRPHLRCIPKSSHLFWKGRPTFQTTAPVTAQVSSHQSPAMAADQKVTFHLFEVAKTPDSGAKTWGSHQKWQNWYDRNETIHKKRLSGATSSTKSLGGEIVQKKKHVVKKKDVTGWVDTRIGALSRTSLCNITSYKYIWPEVGRRPKETGRRTTSIYISYLNLQGVAQPEKKSHEIGCSFPKM